MIDRKKKLRLIQISLLAIGLLIIFFTYYEKDDSLNQRIVSEETQKKIQSQFDDKTQDDGDIFYNISYSGLDLTGNRYILKSTKAQNNKSNKEIVDMVGVDATFYFKDGTVLRVYSDYGIYNNKTLDMDFEGNVKAEYQGSTLFAQKAEYSNVKSFLTISSGVKIRDIRGTLVADKLLFDIKKQKLSISSFNDGKVNANLDLK